MKTLFFVSCLSLSVLVNGAEKCLGYLDLKPSHIIITEKYLDLISDLHSGTIPVVSASALKKNIAAAEGQEGLFPVSLDLLKNLSSPRFTSKEYTESCLETAHELKDGYVNNVEVQNALNDFCYKYLGKQFKNFIANSPEVIERSIKKWALRISNYEAESIPLTREIKKLKAKKNDAINLIAKELKEQKLPLSWDLVEDLGSPAQLVELYYATGADNNNVEVIQQKIRTLWDSYKKTFRENKREMAASIAQKYIEYVSANSSSLAEHSWWKKLIAISKDMDLYGQQTIALGSSELAMRLAANDEELSTAIFTLLWPDIKTKNFKNIVKMTEERHLVDNFAKYDSRLKFWIAKGIEETGNTNLSKLLYQKLLTSAPIDFYSTIAVKTLHKLNDEKTTKAFIESITRNSDFKPLPFTELPKDFQRSLQKIALLLDLEQDELVEAEIKKAYDYTFADKNLTFNPKQILTHVVTDYLSCRSNHLQSFKVIYSSIDQDILELNKPLLEHLFPSKYLDMIKAVPNKIDPYIILSLIRQESAFNPQARSIAGAQGLMQIMPSTARHIQRINKRDLKKPEVNLKVGIKYLNQMMRSYDGNLIYTLAAYNAGPQKVNSWIKGTFSSNDPLVSIEEIPYEETRRYVKLIYRNYFFYKLMEGHYEHIEHPLAQSFFIQLI